MSSISGEINPPFLVFFSGTKTCEHMFDMGTGQCNNSTEYYLL